MYKISAVFIGMLIAVMVTFNGALAGYTSSMFSVLIVHVVGLLAIGTIVLVRREGFKLEERLPPYLFFGGMIGVLLTYLNNICMNALGVSLTLALGLLGQAALSGVVDHFGLFGMNVYRFEVKKLFGFGLVLAGIIFMVLF